MVPNRIKKYEDDALAVYKMMTSRPERLNVSVPTDLKRAAVEQQEAIGVHALARVVELLLLGFVRNKFDIIELMSESETED